MFDISELRQFSYMLLFVLSMAYIQVSEKRKMVKVICVYVPCITCILMWFNPLLQNVLGSFMDERAARYIWLVQYNISIAYAATRIILSTKERKKQVMVAILVIFTVVISGGPYWISVGNTTEHIENVYRIPNETIEVANIIDTDGYEKRVLATRELSFYLRMYDGDIQLCYARDNWLTEIADAYENVNSDTVDEKVLTDMSKEYNYWYIVLKAKTADSNDMKSYGYDLIGHTNESDIYRISHDK